MNTRVIRVMSRSLAIVLLLVFPASITRGGDLSPSCRLSKFRVVGEIDCENTKGKSADTSALLSFMWNPPLS